MAKTEQDSSAGFITTALFSLMEKADYADITITEITRRAGVGRATFYRHFSSKDDIIRKYFALQIPRHIAMFPYRPRRKEECYDIVFSIFSSFKEYKPTMQLILKAGLESIYLDFLNEEFAAMFERQFSEHGSYAAFYFAGSLYNVCIQWLRRDCAESPKELTDIYLRELFPEF